MHYYTFHPKDYMSKTNFLQPLEDLAYRRMLDYQYLNESPLPTDLDEIAMLVNMRSHSDSIAVVLRYFFELTEDGYINDRAEQEIAKYQEKSEKARKSANARWKKKAPKPSKDEGSSDDDANALQTDCEGNANHKPITINQEPLTTNTESEENASESDYLVNFWNGNRPSNAQVKLSVWSKKVKARLKTFTADEIKQAMLFVINDSWYQSNSQVLIKNVIDSDDRCAAVLEKSSQPAKTNQVESHGTQQPKQSRYDNHKQSLQQQLQKQFEAEDAQQGVDSFDCRDVYEMDN